MGGRLCITRHNKLNVMERISKLKLVPVPHMNKHKSFFFTDATNSLWKLHYEDSQNEINFTFYNLRMIMKLPSSNYIIQPTFIRRASTVSIAICMPRGHTDLLYALDQDMHWSDINYGLHHLARGLHWLHEHNIAHRDIKPDNVVIDQGEFKWIDFDYSSSLDDWIYCGTKHYAMPISICHQWQCSNASRSKRMDVYAFGKTILIVLLKFYRKHYSFNEELIYKMFLKRYLTCEKHYIKGEPGQWLTCAIQCCQFVPPIRIPLPTTKTDTSRTGDVVTIRAPTKMLLTNPSFTQEAQFTMPSGPYT